MEIGDIKEILGSKYLILDILDFNNRTYCFTNKLDKDDNVSEVHELYKVIDNIFIKEENESILREILPKIQEDLVDVVNEVMEDNDGK